MKENNISNAPMLNAYPDSMGGTLGDIVNVLKKTEFAGAFSSFYILPSLFNTDLDRGFSVISYDLNERMASTKDLDALTEMGVDLKLDFILNHASVLSEQFQDIIKNGEASIYKDFFINWNKFWEGHGEMSADGYIVPDADLIKDMFFRKVGLPILMVRFPSGESVPYWNTFYQAIKYPKVDAQDMMKLLKLQYYAANEVAVCINNAIEVGIKPDQIELGDYSKHKSAIVAYLESQRKYLGQMDLNIKSPLVWSFYEHVLKTLASYGAKIVRLDAFAYAPKTPGERNFLNEPDTWELLENVRNFADKYHLSLLPEIHASYAEKQYEKIASNGYMTYDFFLPGLIIDAIEGGNGDLLKAWADEIIEKKMRVVNMLGCHDGIPLLDLKGMLSEERIEALIETIVGRGGMVKNLHGQKNIYYQVNATYYSALDENDEKMLMARALQLFMPGKPQVWYLDVFAGVNDVEAVKRAGADGHKEINRTNLSLAQIEKALKKPVVQKQLEMLKFRSNFPAFSFDSKITITNNEGILIFKWENEGYVAELSACLTEMTYSIIGRNLLGEVMYKL
ncbi:alpha-amylase family protein [Fusibacter bizertensis]